MYGHTTRRDETRGCRSDRCRSKLIPELGGDPSGSECAGARRGQFDGQGQAVKAAADGAHGFGIFIARSELRSSPAGAVAEELDGEQPILGKQSGRLGLVDKVATSVVL